MRVLHARTRVFDKDYAFDSNFSVLVWIFSLLKWKEYGHEVVLYTDNYIFNNIKSLGFDHLYSEINTELLKKSNYPDIDFLLYWAMPKLIAFKHEHEMGNKVVVTDQDVVPMSDWSIYLQQADITVWSNKEFPEIQWIYPPIEELSLPDGYTLPRWFTGKNTPLNTGVLYFKSSMWAKMYVDEALKMAVGNKNPKNNSNCITMCNAEQRLLGEWAKWRKLAYQTVQATNDGLFNSRAIHTHGYKSVINSKNERPWTCALLTMIKELDEEMYEHLINMPRFTGERLGMKYFSEFPAELQQYRGDK